MVPDLTNKKNCSAPSRSVNLNVTRSLYKRTDKQVGWLGPSERQVSYILSVSVGMAALTDAAPPSRRQQNRLWDSDAWSCPDPERCVRCDCAISSPSTPAAGIVKFILDNQAASYEDDDHEDSPDEDGERWFMVGCRRPYQYEPLAQGDLDDEEDELAMLLLEEKTTLVVAVDDNERQHHQVKAATEIKKKKKKKADSSNSDDSSSSSNSSSSSSDSDDSSSSSNTSDSSDSSSSSNSSSSSSSSSSSDSSDSSTSSDSSSSDPSGDDSQKKKKRKHHPSNSNSKERDSCSKGRNISRNKNPLLENSHAPLVATAEDNGNPDDYDDDDDDNESFKGIPRTTSMLSVVMKVPQTTSSHSTVEDCVIKAHRGSGDELERKNSSKQSKKHHHKRDR